MPTIHDSGYKKLFSNKVIFRQLIETFVKEDWVKDLDFDSCDTVDKSFISEHYKETESDIIGEQTVLVGGLIELIKKGFEVLVEAGYQPELAYFEACNEAKLIMDMIYRGGFIGMLKAVSDTAKYGGLTVGPKVIDGHVKENMKKVVEFVQSGQFAEEWTKKSEKSKEVLNALMKEIEGHQIEKVGRFIRRTAGIEK